LTSQVSKKQVKKTERTQGPKKKRRKDWKQRDFVAAPVRKGGRDGLERKEKK